MRLITLLKNKVKGACDIHYEVGTIYNIYPPTILIGKTGFTPGFWEWLTSGAACIAVNMATVPCRCSFPSKVTTRAPNEK